MQILRSEGRQTSFWNYVLLLIVPRSRKWLSFLLPPQDQEQSVLREAGMPTPPSTSHITEAQNAAKMPSPPQSPLPNPDTPPNLRRLLDETADLIESPMFSHVLTLLLDATFSHLADTKLRSEAYKQVPLAVEPSPAARITEVTENDPGNATAKLATILAVMTREAHKIGNGVPNEYVHATESVQDLEGFAAVVYSSNFEPESGFQTSVTSDSTASSNKNEAKLDARTLVNMSAEGVEEAARVDPSSGIIGRATGIVDVSRAGFESAWGRVTGRG